MSKIGICLGGVDNGKMIQGDVGVYCALGGGIITTYRQVDLVFRKEIRQPYFQKSYLLNQPFKIYVPASEYYEYEGTLKFILSKWMEAEWGEL